ncbi:exported hypothetical protein [Xenorhabdus bovienii str. oregonense]|uniref:Uncharacterized protein n=1 Tax=Xenorhabdus bovienii str. oregonense TaxID=1398202 RepID=A0A077NSE8_XENBV|nr:hypothetical protein [Xenorhabdus bovienii]CDH05007.1 exported hypothetical protein [Xenorhabdus bovienii str. oregonense]
MKEILLIGVLAFSSFSVFANQVPDYQEKIKEYETLKPLAQEVLEQSVKLAEGIYQGYQSHRYGDGKIWREQRAELNALKKKRNQLGVIVFKHHFGQCSKLINAVDGLWRSAMGSDNTISLSFFDTYVEAEKSCQYVIDNPPEDNSNLRAVDLSVD